VIAAIYSAGWWSVALYLAWIGWQLKDALT
jgi:hypothetical protein